MTVTSELKEIREMLRKIIRDMTKIRETQKQMKEEMYEVKDDLRKFRESWKKEKYDIENRIMRLEERDTVKRELMQRLMRFEKMQEAIEIKENNSNNSIKCWDDCMQHKTKIVQQQQQQLSVDLPPPPPPPPLPASAFLPSYDIERRIECVLGDKDKSHKSTVNIEYKKLCINEKNMILKDGRRLIKQFFGGGRTDL
ncbi:shootin-1-like [Trichogramma pretiosum]|uniref:shootin-1-like n=1 Tax=Trichogramma pretiosum TaxID=7493 RepID=UPI0006C9A46E|nr:shootin-1-like [Trichogramma pretiosum]XP_014236394.1 shootin-1-like [Trichogramma pretiosum]